MRVRTRAAVLPPAAAYVLGELDDPRRAAVEVYDSGICTRDEARRMMGLAEVGGEKGKAYQEVKRVHEKRPKEEQGMGR